MKVAMLSTVGGRCGIAAYTRDLVQALEPLVDIEVIPIEPGKLPIERYEAQANELNEADVVHIQHEHSFWGGILPNRSAFWNLRYLIQKPIVITAHTTTSLADLLRLKEERRLPHRLAKEFLVRRSGYRDSVEIAPFITGRCIVHTKQGKDELVSRGAKPAFVHVIPAGIPKPLPKVTMQPTFRERFQLIGRRIISIFGYIAPNKGYEVALDALKGLPADVTLLIAGGSRSADMEEYEARLRGAITASGMADRVVVSGYLSDDEVAEVMSESDLIVAPHTYATGSYSITIPLAYGKAIVASDQACFREIESESHAIKIVPTGDATKLQAAIREILEDENVRKGFETASLQYASERSWSIVAKKTVEIYNEAILDVERLAHHSVPAVRH